MSVNIRILGPKDANLRASFAQAAIEAVKQGSGIGWDPKSVGSSAGLSLIGDWFVARLANPETCIFVATMPHTPQKIIGSVQLVRPHPFHSAAAKHRASVERLFVRPDMREQGIGGKLMGRLIEEACKAGIEHLSLDVRDSKEQAPAHELYRRLGFLEWGRERNYAKVGDTVYSGIHMALDLTE